MPMYKKGNCLLLTIFDMKNEQEMLELFKVEVLEKRCEMGRWIGSVKVGVSPSGHTQSL